MPSGRQLPVARRMPGGVLVFVFEVETAEWSYLHVAPPTWTAVHLKGQFVL